MQLHQTLLCMQSFLIIIGVNGIGEKLLFSTVPNLKEIDLDTGVVRTLATLYDYVFSLAYDDKERYMYVPRNNKRDIVRFPYPNNHTVMLETIVSTRNPFGVAFDSVNRHLYWTDLSSKGMINRCNPDGSNVMIILNEDSPSAITLDIQNSWIYYGQNKAYSEIFRANFDGTDKRVIKNMTAVVYGIGVDVNVKRLYWMEYLTGDLQSAYFNGSDVRTIVSTNATGLNWAIDVYKEFIFYTSNNQIMKIEKSLAHTPTVVYTDTQRMYGLLLYKQDGKDCDENK